MRKYDVAMIACDMDGPCRPADLQSVTPVLSD
jgi:hypothetical protein